MVKRGLKNERSSASDAQESPDVDTSQAPLSIEATGWTTLGPVCFMCVIKNQRMVCMGGWNRFMIVGMDWFDSFMIAALSPVSPGKQRWTEPFWGGPTYGSDPNTDHILYQMMMIVAATHCLHRQPYHSDMILLEEEVNVDEEGVFGCGPAAHSVSRSKPTQLAEQTKRLVSYVVTSVTTWTGPRKIYS